MGARLVCIAVLVMAFAVSGESFYVTLDNGRRAVLHPDKTWDYVDGGGTTAHVRLKSDLVQLSAKGMAKKGDVLESSKFALQTAVRKIAGSLRPQLIGTVSEASLTSCIEAEAGDTDLLKNFGGDGSVEIKIELDRGNIDNIVNCLNSK